MLNLYHILQVISYFMLFIRLFFEEYIVLVALELILRYHGYKDCPQTETPFVFSFYVNGIYIYSVYELFIFHNNCSH